MRTAIQSTCLVLALYSGSTLAGSDAPTFEDCPATVSTLQKAVHVKLLNVESRRYAAQLRYAAKQPINFAGHYILASWGCGAGCVMGGAIDVKNGNVTMLPFTVSDWPLEVTEPLSFKKDSCLLVAQGSRNEKGHGIYYYRFSGNKFALVKSVNR